MASSTEKPQALVLSDYSLLKDLKLSFQREGGAFSLCFWVYLLNPSAFPCTIIRQMQADIEDDVPFLTLNKDKKMVLFPLFFLRKEVLLGKSSSWCGVPCISADIVCPFRKWVHVGCEVSSNVIRLHINGFLVGEKLLYSLLKNESDLKDFKEITLAAGDGGNEISQGYVHHVQILPQNSSVNDHFIKNLPIELSIDTSCLYEIEEEEDGVWNIVGGKASCRRNFTLDVVLLDAFGGPANGAMEVVASLVYADNGAPVEKPNDAEAPLLTSYDGIEFASSERPSKLLHGRASFKLKISQLSSKCSNRLFRVRFDSLKTPRYPFLEAYSNPIRCISRTRSSRTSSTIPKRPFSASNPLNRFPSLRLDEGSSESQQIHVDGNLPISSVQVSKSFPPPEGNKFGGEKSLVTVQDGLNRGPHDGCSSRALNTNQGGNAFGACVEDKPENGEGTENIPSDSESVQSKEPSSSKVRCTGNSISDETMFKYCLGSTNDRYLILKEVTTYATDVEMANFAEQVHTYTGCSHHRCQISIAKRLLMEGTDAWEMISKGNILVPWRNAAVVIEEQFMRISGCSTRRLMDQDFALLRGIAGGGQYLTRENFDNIWYWLYPVAFTLSRDWIRPIWECTSPRWLEGFITTEEAVSSLRSPRSPGGVKEPGTFILRFPTTRSWPHPDAGNFVITLVEADFTIHHRILDLDYSNIETSHQPLEEVLLAEPQLTTPGRVIR